MKVMDSQTSTPKWVWFLLTAAVFGVSSAGALFHKLTMYHPYCEPRGLQLTSIVLAPLALMNGSMAIIETGFMEKETIFWLLAGGSSNIRGLGC